MKPTKIILVAVLAAVVGLGWVAYRVYRYVYVVVPNAYAVWNVADLVIVYMETHDGAWPRGWDDLREPYQTRQVPHSFESLQSRVEVDWDADPAQLARAPPTDEGPPFRVIWLRDGSRSHWQEKEPNRMILEYLQKRTPPKN